MLVECLDGLVNGYLGEVRPALALSLQEAGPRAASLNTDDVVPVHRHLTVAFPDQLVDRHLEGRFRVYVLGSDKLGQVAGLSLLVRWQAVLDDVSSLLVP